MSQRAAPTQTNAALLVHLECVVHLRLTGEQLTANPMQLDGRPKLAKPPAQQCRHSWKPSHKTKTLNTEPIGLKGISR
jgi:hypothetical protein